MFVSFRIDPSDCPGPVDVSIRCDHEHSPAPDLEPVPTPYPDAGTGTGTGAGDGPYGLSIFGPRLPDPAKVAADSIGRLVSMGLPSRAVVDRAGLELIFRIAATLGQNKGVANGARQVLAALAPAPDDGPAPTPEF